MLKKAEDNRKQIELLCLEQLVPEEHLVRKIENAIDFSFIYDEVKDLYGDVGRNSIDPVSLIKITFVQYMFGIRSMRQTIKELEVNLAYKWKNHTKPTKLKDLIAKILKNIEKIFKITKFA